MVNEITRALTREEVAWIQHLEAEERRSCRVTMAWGVGFALPLFACLLNLGARFVALIPIGLLSLVIYACYNFWASKRDHANGLADVARNGTAIESRVISERCFVVDDLEDDETDYFFDTGEQATLFFSTFRGFADSFPVSDFLFIRFSNSGGSIFAKRVQSLGGALLPIAVFDRVAPRNAQSIDSASENDSYSWDDLGLITMSRSFAVVLAEQAAVHRERLVAYPRPAPGTHDR